MKRIITYFLMCITLLSVIVGCKEKTIETEGKKYASQTISAYQKRYGNDAIADGSLIKVIYNNEYTFFKIEKGNLSEPNKDIELLTRDTQTKITSEYVPEIKENTILFLEVGSVLPDGFAEEEALRQAKQSLKYYQVPIQEGGEPRIMPDESIFVIEINGKQYYIMCMDNAIKDQNPEYKTLVESEKYYDDPSEFFALNIELYFKSEEISPADEALEKATDAIRQYQRPRPDSEPIEIPDSSIIVIKLDGKTYYFMVENGAIKDQNKEYKKLTKSNDYEKSDMEFGEGISLYIKKTK